MFSIGDGLRFKQPIIKFWYEKRDALVLRTSLLLIALFADYFF